MIKKPGFSPKEAVASIVQAAAASYLTASGMPLDQASGIGAGLSGVVKGLTFSEGSTGDSIQSAFKRAFETVLNSGDFELPDNCRALLEDNVLSPQEIKKYMCQPNAGAEAYLRAQFIQQCSQDSAFDVETFPVNAFVKEVIAQFGAEISDHYELATHMLHGTNDSNGIYLAVGRQDI